MQNRSWRRRWSAGVFIVLALAGCGVQAAAPVAPVVIESASEEGALLPVTLSVDAVHALYAAGEISIIDVRETYEYDAGHIPGAALIPLGELPARLDEIPPDETVVVVCRSGNRSSQAQRFLAGEGFDNVHNMLGGMNAWANAGHEIER